VQRDTRTRILDTALELFAARGVEAVTVTELEAGAGLSPGSGSFYRHFRSKEDVLAAVVSREIDRIQARQPPASRTIDLESDYHRALDTFDLMGPLLALLVREGAQLPNVQRIREVLGEGGTRIDAERLRSLMDAGTVPERDAEAIATVAMMALVGFHLADRFFGNPIGVDRDRFVSALAALVGDRRSEPVAATAYPKGPGRMKPSGG
jgi:AcrR family transcriptional regulator